LDILLPGEIMEIKMDSAVRRTLAFIKNPLFPANSKSEMDITPMAVVSLLPMFTSGWCAEKH
jgi:hypothetical protein